MSQSAFKILFVLLAFASIPTQRAFGQSGSYESEALYYIKHGNAAENAGDYVTACRSYGEAWGKYEWVEDAVREEWRYIISSSNRGWLIDDTDFQYNLRIIRKNRRQAHDLKEAACKLAEAMPQGVPQSNEIVYPKYVRPDLSADVTALQTTINSAFAFANESSRLRKARSFAPACARARAAAITYGKAKDEASTLMKKSGSYNEVGVLDMRALRNIADQSSRDAEEYYCKAQLPTNSFKAELAAFAALKSALHLERGSVTPIDGQKVVTMKSACSTKAIGDAIDAQSVFANALLDGCQSFVFMYNMQMPDRACDALTKAKANLARVEPNYSAQAQKLAVDFTAVQGAFKCAADKPISVSTGRIQHGNQGVQLEVIQSELPPMKLDIKALPVRVL